MECASQKSKVPEDSFAVQPLRQEVDCTQTHRCCMHAANLHDFSAVICTGCQLDSTEASGSCRPNFTIDRARHYSLRQKPCAWGQQGKHSIRQIIVDVYLSAQVHGDLTINRPTFLLAVCRGLQQPLECTPTSQLDQVQSRPASAQNMQTLTTVRHSSRVQKGLAGQLQTLTAAQLLRQYVLCLR